MGDIIIREVSMRGAPMSRNDWLARYQQHDVLKIEFPSRRISLVPEMEDVMAPEMVAETTTAKTAKGERQVPTGRELSTGEMIPSGKKRPTGKMIVKESDGPPVTLYISLNSGVIGFELDPNIPDAPAAVPALDDNPQA